MKAIMRNLKNDDHCTMMYCPICGAESSANRSDYFMSHDIYNDNLKFTCCGRTMDLVVKKTRYVNV